MMKRAMILGLVLVLIPFCLGLTTDIKSSYQPGETLIATLEGSFLSPLSSSDIYFYSGNTFIPMVYDLGKVNDKYYLYALLPMNIRNYSLVIKDAHYFEAGIEKFQDLTYDFNVAGEAAGFYVNPGFVITNKDFSVMVKNLGETGTISASFNGASQSKTLSSGESTRLSFSIAGIEGFQTSKLEMSGNAMQYGISVAVYGAETVPIETEPGQCSDNPYKNNVYVQGSAIAANGSEFFDVCVNQSVNKYYCLNNVLKQKNLKCSGNCSDGACVNQTEIIDDAPVITLSKSMKFLEQNLNLSFKVLHKSNISFQLTLSNTGQSDIRNVRFNLSSLSNYLTSNPSFFDIEAGETKTVNFTFFAPNRNISVEGEIIAYAYNVSSPISLKFETTSNLSEVLSQRNGTNTSIPVEIPIGDFTCSSMGGRICPLNEGCSMEYVTSSDGLCCKGSCGVQQDDSGDWSTYLWVAVIIALIAGVGFFVLKKIRPKPKSADEMIKESSMKFQERFKPTQIRGGLTKE